MSKYIACYIDSDSLNGEAYRNFMELLFSKSDTFTYIKLDTDHPKDEEDKYYAEKIRKFEALTKTDYKGKYLLSNYGMTSGNVKQIYVLNLKSNSLKSYIKNKKNISEWSYPECVEDIGFYKSNRCVFESCSHEEMYRIYVNSENDVDRLINCGVIVSEQYEINESVIPVLG